MLEDLLVLSEDLIESCVSKRITTSFLEEPGVDVGGVIREMWCLLVSPRLSVGGESYVLWLSLPSPPQASSEGIAVVLCVSE